MAAAFRSLAGTTYASRIDTTISKPTGTVDGDILIMMHIVGGSPPPTTTLPSGWTTFSGYPLSVADGGFQIDTILAWKLASSEGASYTVSHGGPAQHNSDGVIVAVSGATSTGIQAGSSNGTGTSSTATGITTSGSNALVLWLGHNWSLYGSAAVPAGPTPTFTERQDSGTSLIYVATGVLAAAGATGNTSQSDNDNGAGSDPWRVALVGVESPSAGGNFFSFNPPLRGGLRHLSGGLQG